jgi:restriction system protein
MPVPDYQSLMRPILELLSDREEHVLADLRERLSARLGLSEGDLAERLTTGNQTIFANRVAWAVQYLKAAGAVAPVRRTVYRITDRGADLIKNGAGNINARTLRQFPEFEEFAGKLSSASNGPTPASEVEDSHSADSGNTPEESMQQSFKLQREALAVELLESVRNGTPGAFEKLVVDLLLAMGYGGSVENAGEVVGCSGDGGNRRRAEIVIGTGIFQEPDAFFELPPP